MTKGTEIRGFLNTLNLDFVDSIKSEKQAHRALKLHLINDTELMQVAERATGYNSESVYRAYFQHVLSVFAEVTTIDDKGTIKLAIEQIADCENGMRLSYSNFLKDLMLNNELWDCQTG